MKSITVYIMIIYNYGRVYNIMFEINYIHYYIVGALTGASVMFGFG